MKRGVVQSSYNNSNHSNHSNSSSHNHNVDAVRQQQQQQQQQHYYSETNSNSNNSNNSSNTMTTGTGGNGPFVPLEETLHSNYNHQNQNAGSSIHTTTQSSTPTISHQHRQMMSPLSSVPNATSSSSSSKTMTTTAAAAASSQQPHPSHEPFHHHNNNNNIILHRLHQIRRIVLYKLKSLDMKKVISSTVFTLLFLLITDSLWSPPDQRVVPPNFANHFLLWVQDHPASGMIWILLVMSMAVVCMIPIGTPLTLGCGYIYKGAYGWQLGVVIATGVSMLGSALGAVICFLLGRYMMRDVVKKWIRKYPIFDAIDIAATEHGLRIMAMLYLTPILPLGPVSYMCGTTSLKLSHFIMAKIAALPLMLLYVLIGASTGTLISTSSKPTDGNDNNNNTNNNNSSPTQSIENNETLIISGILLSFASIAGITHYIKKELNHILERQKRELEQNGSSGNNSNNISSSNGIEFTTTSATASTASSSSSALLKDVEHGTTTTALENNFIHILESGNVPTTTAIMMTTPLSKSAILPSSSSTTTTTVLMQSDVIPVTTATTTTSTSTNTAPRQRKH